MPAHSIVEYLPGQWFMLRQAVVLPYESVDQLIAEHGGRDLGDPLTPGTWAWHLRHIAEIFRLPRARCCSGWGRGSNGSMR